MRITPEACRAGRALLGWSMRDLAQNARVSLGVVNRLESGARRSRGATQSKLIACFAANGVDLVADSERTGASLIYAQRREASHAE